MTWNHRVVKHIRHVRGQERIYFQIHEVYYDDEGEYEGRTTDAVAADGDTLEELREELQQMIWACNKEVLICREVPDKQEDD